MHLRVAGASRKRGYEVVLATKPDTIARIRGEGLRAIGFKNACTQIDKYPDMEPRTIRPRGCSSAKPSLN